MAQINTAPAAALDDMYNSLYKYVKQYITSGNLKTRFDVFEREEVPYGNGLETNIILAAKNQRTGEALADRASEHGTYKPKVITVTSTEKTGKQYAVTISEDRLAKVVGDDAKLREYAAEITESLYQGWIDDKNADISGLFPELTNAVPARIEIPLGSDPRAYAQAMLTNVKALVEDLREGIAGSSYGNSYIGENRIAAQDVVIIMSNSLAATLDTYGFAQVFSPEYLETRNVTRITSNRVTEGEIIITDARNIILHKRNEKLVNIQNSDGSVNIFYNVNYYIDTAIDDTAGKNTPAFPVKVITTAEAAEAAETAAYKAQELKSSRGKA